MFIRETITTNKKTGVKYTKHCLVESYRIGGVPRQRVIMQLGSLSLPKSDWPKLAAILEARLAGQPSLFEDDLELAKLAAHKLDHAKFVEKRHVEKANYQNSQELLVVDFQSFTVSESRSLGPELVAHSFWERLGFDGILRQNGFSITERALAKAVIIGRLVAPDSELATWQWLKHRTALLELLPVDLQDIGKDAVYEISDCLLKNKQQIEKALYQKESILFPDRPLLFLYDLTNTYFEGNCLKNTLAGRGKSKENRNDAPLVTLALLVDGRGFPVFSQIYGGNQSEPETLENVLNRLERDTLPLFPEYRPTIVMDRGIATTANITLLKRRKFPYLVIERRPVEREYLSEFGIAKETFERFAVSETESIYLKKLDIEGGCRILCLSEGREQKEMAIDTLKEQRFLDDISRLKTSVNRGNIVLERKVLERIGRLKQKYATIARYYDLNLRFNESGERVTDLFWEKKTRRDERAILTGCYVIETTHQEYDAREIWRLYMTLTMVEAAFRDLKTDLGLRPVHHQLARRTEGHLFISVLAYHLLICIEETLRQNDDTRRWSTIRKQLATHQRTTVIMTDAERRIHHCRLSGMPESFHQQIYRLLNIRDPLKRLNRIAGSRL